MKCGSKDDESQGFPGVLNHESERFSPPNQLESDPYREPQERVEGDGRVISNSGIAGLLF